MAETVAPSPDLLILAFEQIAERGWAGFALAGLAERAGTSLLEVHRQLAGRRAVLGALSRRIDEAMLGFERAELEGLPPRDRVFELIMRRLDALAPFRAGLRRLAREAPCHPATALLTACRIDRSMRWLQEAAELPTSGLRSRLRRRALGAVYLQALRVWFRDESVDLAKTMAELDRQLRRIEPVAGLRERRTAAAPDGEA
ncbi:MAG: TetR family transcriptional regulator, partial [Geminicoccales bacterium]